jgi:hypothetical protein
MKGVITDINIKKGMVSVQTESEDFSIFEILGDDNFEIGDEVEWIEEQPLGGSKITNFTQNETSDVFFQNHWVSLANLKKQLLY